MVSISNREWRSGMTPMEKIYNSSYKNLDKAPLNDVIKAKKGLHLYRKLQAEVKHFERLSQCKYYDKKSIRSEVQ